MASNGRLPDSQLSVIPGRSRLRSDAARAYRAMHAESMRRFGVSLALYDGSISRGYRTYNQQVQAKRTYGSNAATPGTSNHGWGLAVDLASRQQRWAIDRIGAKYGWAKRWSDASWEWWHLRWRPGVWKGASTSTFRPLRYRSQGSRVKWVQRRLRSKGYPNSVPGPGQPGYGFFGVSTRKAVWRFQRRKGLTTDGIVGKATWRALGR